MAAREGRPKSAWSDFDSGTRRGRRPRGGASALRENAVGRIARTKRKPCGRRAPRRLVDDADDCELGRGPETLSGERGRLPSGGTAAESAMEHPNLGAPAAEQAERNPRAPRR